VRSIAGTDAREELRTLLAENSVMHGDFVLSSGKKSKYYIDARLVTLSGRGSPLVGKVFLDALSAVWPDAVAGLTIGADPIVSAIATVSGLYGTPIDGLLVRKQAKEHGGRRRVEGPARAGITVAVVEDVVTTGASILDVIRAVEEAGCRVTGVYALIDRDEGGREAIEGAGHAYHSIFSASELLSSDHAV
jgi:orotate phosphoribosyltransferase